MSALTYPKWVWADVPLITIDYLRPLLSVPVFTVVPAIRPASFVRVQRVGGVASGPIDSARILLECWAATEAAAAALVAIVREHMRAMRGTLSGFMVAGPSESGGPASIADPIAGLPRYLLTVVVPVRANPGT